MKRRDVATRLLRQMRPLLGWMGLAILLGLLTIASGIGLMTLSAYLISVAALQPSLASIAVAILAVRVFGILRGILRYLERIVSHETTFRLLTQLRVWFYHALEPLAPARLMANAQANELDYSSGDLLSRLVSDIETLQEFYIRVIAPPFVALLVTLIMVFVLKAFNVRFAVTLLSFVFLAGAGIPLLTYLLSRKLGQRIILARSALYLALVESIQGVADLIAFNQEGRQSQKVQQLNRQLVYLQARMARIGGLREALGIFLVDGCVWTMLIIAIPLVHTGQLEGTLLAVVILAAIGTFEAIAPLSTAAQHLGSSMKAGQRLFEVIDTPPLVQEPTGSSPAPSSYGLEIRHLSFRYPQQESNALDDVSFAIPPGQCVAIVGPSGAGKSTIANLLVRFWDYEQGSIQLGGHELRSFHQKDLHQLVSVVEQHTHLFNSTVRENLLIARPGATQVEIEAEARKAEIHDVIEALPLGYDTLIGEEGFKLSGGERQRLAIARALLKDAPILIFDEATANIDTSAEYAVLRAFQQAIQGRTTLLMTHRLVGLDIANEILVVQSGKIRERGTLQDLLQAEGLFWQLWQIQNQTLPPA